MTNQPNTPHQILMNVQISGIHYADYPGDDNQAANAIAEAKASLDHYYYSQALEAVGRDREPDKPFATPNGGLSNMGPNNFTNRVKREIREALAIQFNQKVR